MLRIIQGITFLSLFFTVAQVYAEIPARLRRIDIKPHSSFTRLIFQMDRETPHTLTELPDRQKVRLTIPDADSPLFRRFRSYADQNIAGITVARRGSDLLVTIGLQNASLGVRELEKRQSIVLDVGTSVLSVQNTTKMPAGREGIWKGAQRLIQEYDAPLKSELSFVPTERNTLLTYLNKDETALFIAGEAALYKGQAADAALVFEAFMKGDSKLRALAAYRCGEARYLLNDFSRALLLFREGERLWPHYLTSSPPTAFYYADSLVRNGELVAGRKMLMELIASQAGKNAGPVLLVRLADVLARMKRNPEANLIYKTVVEKFPENKAAGHAAIELADSRFLKVNQYGYLPLRDEYRKIGQESGDNPIREEALFKAALLESVFGPGLEALQSVFDYEKRHPKSPFINIVKSIHEDIMPSVFHELKAANDLEAVVKTADEHALYLGKAMADPAFIKDLDKAFYDLGLIQEEVALFGKIVRREWAAPYAPFMYAKMADNSIALADWATVESSAREYIKRFPSFPDASRMREILGDVDYRKGNLAAVKIDLAWLLSEKMKPIYNESYYYLGKALEYERQFAQAGRAMESYIAAVKQNATASPLTSDAHLVAGMGQKAGGNLTKAMESYNAAMALAAPEGKDRILYRIGELHQAAGRADDARSSWDKIIKDGTDEVWQRLAAQAVADLQFKQVTGARL